MFHGARGAFPFVVPSRHNVARMEPEPAPVDRVATEVLIPLSRVPALLSRSTPGRKLAIEAIRRWKVVGTELAL